MRVSLSTIAALAALIMSPAHAQQDPTLRALNEKWPELLKIEGIEIVPVQKNIYLLAGGGANVTLQVGEEGAMLVDSGSLGNAEKLMAAVRHFTRKPLRFLVNTSPDPDHDGGNEGIVKAAGGPTGIVAGAIGRPANSGVLTMAHQDAVNRMTSGAAPLKGDAVPVSTFFTGKKEFYANGEAVQLFSQPHAHSEGDLIVFFRGSDVISAGDAYRTDSYPILNVAAGATLQGEIDALNMILDSRLHISWRDDRNLKMEFDNGNQERLLRFDRNAPPPTQATWQGTSLASWETVREGEGMVRVGGGGGGRGGGGGGAGGPGGFGANTPAGTGLSGSLKSVTTKMRPGYLRRNGVPYSANTVLTEFIDRTEEPNGDTWLVLTSVIDDPQYLTEPFILTTHFKREADAAKFNPKPCEVTPPVTGKTVRAN